MTSTPWRWRCLGCYILSLLGFWLRSQSRSRLPCCCVLQGSLPCREVWCACAACYDRTWQQPCRVTLVGMLCVCVACQVAWYSMCHKCLVHFVAEQQVPDGRLRVPAWARWLIRLHVSAGTSFQATLACSRPIATYKLFIFSSGVLFYVPSDHCLQPGWQILGVACKSASPRQHRNGEDCTHIAVKYST